MHILQCLCVVWHHMYNQSWPNSTVITTITLLYASVQITTMTIKIMVVAEQGSADCHTRTAHMQTRKTQMLSFSPTPPAPAPPPRPCHLPSLFPSPWHGHVMCVCESARVRACGVMLSTARCNTIFHILRDYIARDYIVRREYITVTAVADVIV